MAWATDSRKPDRWGIRRGSLLTDADGRLGKDAKGNTPLQGRHRNNRQFWPLLDRTQPDSSLNAEGDAPTLALDNIAVENPPVAGWQRPLGWLRRAGQFFFALSF